MLLTKQAMLLVMLLMLSVMLLKKALTLLATLLATLLIKALTLSKTLLLPKSKLRAISFTKTPVSSLTGVFLFRVGA